jgi:hypothetical protein
MLPKKTRSKESIDDTTGLEVNKSSNQESEPVEESVENKDEVHVEKKKPKKKKKNPSIDINGATLEKDSKNGKQEETNEDAAKPLKRKTTPKMEEIVEAANEKGTKLQNATMKSKKRLSTLVKQDVEVKSHSGRVHTLGDKPAVSTLTASTDSLVLVPLAGSQNHFIFNFIYFIFMYVAKSKSTTYNWANVIAVRRDPNNVFTIVTVQPGKKTADFKLMEQGFMTTSEEEADQWVSFLHPFVHSNPNGMNLDYIFFFLFWFFHHF